ncbi:MAG: phosphoribosylglycinamide formyltransferase [Deltaproteobacteria bacterium]|nr:phosphoribosylglycinamide formyltransferase [Deltaproteobacteria bacterium]
MARELSLGVLVSGSGSNLQAIVDAIESDRLDAVIKIVISNNPNAYALERCRRHNIPISVINHCQYKSREAFDDKMISVLTDNGVELVVMAGFMRILTERLLRAFPLRVMNIHPALLPSFPGLHGQRQAFDYGVKFSGCTVHFVDEGVDTGPIIIQAVVPCCDDDTEESLQQKILKEEHRIYPQAIQYFAEGRLEVSGRKVHIKNSNQMSTPSLHNPHLEGF